MFVQMKRRLSPRPKFTKESTPILFILLITITLSYIRDDMAAVDDGATDEEHDALLGATTGAEEEHV